MKNSIGTDIDQDRTQGVITLWIDAYTDIFSDFDPRPFSERIVSDDFITQVKRVSHESNSKVNILRLLIQEGTQIEEDEKVIKKRLRAYFNTMAVQLKDEGAKMRKKGIAFALFGVVLMISSTYIAFLQLSAFVFKLLLALFEPGGWFLLWTGLDLLISNSWNRKHEILFYNRFKNIHVEFSTYK